MGKVLQILSALGSFFGIIVGELDRVRRQKEAKDAQKSYDAIERDPVGEFNRRFNRVQPPAEAGGGSPEDPSAPATSSGDGK
jgi:hypothetical protein